MKKATSVDKEDVSMLELMETAYTHAEAARIIGVSTESLHVMNCRGLGPDRLKSGKNLAYPRAWLNAYLERHVQAIRIETNGVGAAEQVA